METGIGLASPAAAGLSDEILDLGFRNALRRLDAAGRLTKVATPLDPVLEIGSYMHARDGDRALFFERPRGFEVPVAAHLLVSRENTLAIFQRDVPGVRAAFDRALARRLRPRWVAAGPSQEVIRTSGFDLGRDFPLIQHTPGDAGRYITAGVVIARDPHTGVHNASFHRLMLCGPDRLAIKLDYGRHLRRLVEEAQAEGRKLPVVVALGANLALLYAAGTMGAQMPFDGDELDMASSLLGEPLPLVPARTVDLPVPAEAEIVLEGVIDPNDLIDEAPFIEFLWLYAPRAPAPVITVTAVTQRERPIWHSILGRETTMLRKYVMETALLRALQAAVPIVTDVELTSGGLNRFHCVIQVRKTTDRDEGLARNAMLAAIATLKDLDLLIVVDDDIDIRHWNDVEYALATRFDAGKDCFIIPNAKGHEYVAENGVIGKLCIDATVPVSRRHRYTRAAFGPLDLAAIEASDAPGLQLGN